MTEQGSPSGYGSGGYGAGKYGGTIIEEGPPTTVPTHLPRNPRAIQTVDELRHNELLAIHRPLRKLCGADRPRWRKYLEFDKLFGAGAILFIGGAIGGGLGLIPFLASHPASVARREYIALVVIAGLVGLICALARMGMKDKEVDSVHSVYAIVDGILKSYESELAARDSESRTP